MSEAQGSMRRLSSSPDMGIALDNSRTQDVVQSIVSNRKSWKTLRGGEMVWPPELEAALIEG
jgi:transcriptional enhancer factor